MKNPSMTNSNKIINDPLYGFLTIPNSLIFELIEHPYFQRLRYIKQLGLTHLVYPGAMHTRFHHALGALKLCIDAVEILRSKKINISNEEENGLYVAILLHDIGHGPFSHALEKCIIPGLHHEEISLAFMHILNEEFQGKLTLGISIFMDTHPKSFLHQLVSGQLDMDRMDYLNRDSFYSGVVEGIISHDRIIKMLNVHNNELVVEEKGIYSIEKFLIARRLMYWQVYLHKTVVAAEALIVQILSRAKQLANDKKLLPCSESLQFFLYNTSKINKDNISKEILKKYALLDDHDVMSAIKNWTTYNDKILSTLCRHVMNRILPKVSISKEEISPEAEQEILAILKKKYQLTENEIPYLYQKGVLENIAYDDTLHGIKILRKDQSVVDFSDITDNYNISALRQIVSKKFVCYSR